MMGLSGCNLIISGGTALYKSFYYIQNKFALNESHLQVRLVSEQDNTSGLFRTRKSLCGIDLEKNE
jgi:hypothetical protein